MFGQLGFGGLTTAQIARLDSVVEQARVAADEAAALAAPYEVGWTNWLTNPALAYTLSNDSTAAAIRTDAAASQNLYNVLVEKRARLVADPYAGEAQVQEMEGARYAMSNDSMKATVEQLSPSAFWDQVVVQTGEDVVDTVANPLGVPIWAWGLGALALLVVLKRR